VRGIAQPHGKLRTHLQETVLCKSCTGTEQHTANSFYKINYRI